MPANWVVSVRAHLYSTDRQRGVGCGAHPSQKQLEVRGFSLKKLSPAANAFLVFAVLLGVAAADKPRLPERYKKWLDEEVVYIITRVEREVFLKLQTDHERDLFIEAFWKHRDPTPNTPENEFKTEHFRRIDYATHYLGREAPIPGWKTDRGRMYILLGEPQEIQRLQGKLGIYDCEVWFYQGKTDQGLPAGFNLLFFKERGQGMYKLYSPLRDGPQALLSTTTGDPSDYTSAYQSLTDIDPELADVSMSLIPGEETNPMGRPSMTSDLLIQQIETLPTRAVEDRYARKFLEYKDLVEVEYSANYLDSDNLVKVFREPSGQYFVHYAIEPQRLSVNQYESKMYTALKVDGRVTTLDGRLVYQYHKSVSLDMPEAQMATLSHSPFNFHDIFPLISGDYRLSVLMKNETSKEFVSFDQAVRIPQKGTAVELTQPVLGYQVTRLDKSPRKIRAFQVGPFQIFCQPGRIFTAKDTLAVAFQVNNLTEDMARTVELKIRFIRDGQTFREITRKPSEYPDLPDALEQVALNDFPPAHYRVQVSVYDSGKLVVTAEDEFDLTYAAAVSRPWFSSRVLPETGDPIYDQITGLQLFNLGRYAEARVVDERAFGRLPDSSGVAANLAQACLALGDYPKAVQVLTPFLGRPQAAQYEIYTLAGEAYLKSHDFAGAVAVLDQAVSHYGINATLLNALGESYLGLGKPAEALAAFERSLQVSPDQPKIKAKVDGLKKKK
jgi:GWxTD domain-containing protein